MAGEKKEKKERFLRENIVIKITFQKKEGESKLVSIEMSR